MSGIGNIYVMNANGSGQTKLTNGGAYHFDPAWSPDGRKIAFVTSAGTLGSAQISTMNANGSGQTKLTTTIAASEPAWSPDGKKIAFTAYDSSGGSHTIYLMNADGSGQKQLTNTDPTQGQDRSPTWSPGGKTIAFERDGGSSSAPTALIYLMNADASGQTKLTNDQATAQAPDWSPGDEDRVRGRRQPASGRRRRHLHHERRRLRQDKGVDRPTVRHRRQLASVVADGKKIVFVAQEQCANDILVVNADGTHQTQVTHNATDD